MLAFARNTRKLTQDNVFAEILYNENLSFGFKRAFIVDMQKDGV